MYEKYQFFWGGVFSQWHRSQFMIDGVAFGCAEQFMMHQKALLFADTTAAADILNTRDARKQKAIGRKVSNYDEKIWTEQRETIVTAGNFAKFSQNDGLRKKLFQTGEKILIEASPHDAIWGIGLDEDTARKWIPESWPGMNLLGKIITKVKIDLKLLHPDEYIQTNNLVDNS